MDWVLVCVGLLLFHVILTVWLFRQTVFTLQRTVAELDQTIGIAIKQLIEGGLGEIEQINPIQQAIAQMLMKNVQDSPIEAVVKTRDPSGKFQ